MLSGLLGAVLGAIVGGLITNCQAKKVWEDEKQISIRNKKIELIERTVRAISSTDEVNLLVIDNDRLLSMLQVNSKYMDSIRHTDIYLDPQIPETNRQHYNRYFENQRDIYKISGEYAGLIQQNIIFFGDETNQIIKNIEHKFWWKENPKKFQDLIDAMGREILNKE